MPIDLKLDSNKVFHKVFEGTKPGYNATQVDTFLDIVISDYEAVEAYVQKTDELIDNLNKTNKMLKDRLTTTEANLAVLEEKMKNISDNESVSMANLDLLKRISTLEQALFKAGINLSNIK